MDLLNSPTNSTPDSQYLNDFWSQPPMTSPVYSNQRTCPMAEAIMTDQTSTTIIPPSGSKFSSSPKHLVLCYSSNVFSQHQLLTHSINNPSIRRKILFLVSRILLRTICTINVTQVIFFTIKFVGQLTFVFKASSHEGSYQKSITPLQITPPSYSHTPFRASLDGSVASQQINENHSPLDDILPNIPSTHKCPASPSQSPTNIQRTRGSFKIYGNKSIQTFQFL